VVPRTLFAGLVDDAALFPPGNAPMDQALKEHAAVRATSRSDLVGPFLCPASRVTELRAHLPADESIRLVLVFDADGDEAHAALRACGADETLQLVGVEASAARLGADTATVGRNLTRLPGVTGALEVPRAGFEEELALVGGEGEGWTVAKYRTGGTTADAFPSETELAAFLVAAVARQVPVKLTAGLHHAVRGTEAGTGFEHHGVLNVMVATRVAQGGGGREDIAAVLAQRAAPPLVEFVTEWDESTCGDVRATFRSFGCCGVHDPLDELAALGLLAEA
jgi:hypothetical protein